MKRSKLPLLSSLAAAVLAVSNGSASADTCSNLAALSLTDVTITAAQTIPAGNYTAANCQTFNNLPTFCRVAATATPTSQSDISFEVWMPPAGTWNGIFASLDYYTAVIGAAGGPQPVKLTQSFARLFLAPGVTHCGGGSGANVFNGPDNLGGPEDSHHDVFLALRQWVENGVAPTRIIGTKYMNDTPANGVAFTRPMCPYPQLARYRGTGDTTDASSFICVTDNNDSNGPIIADFGIRDTLLGYADLLFFP